MMFATRTKHNVLLLGLIFCTACVAEFHNSGTPKSIPASFDCAVRKAAWEYGKSLLPGRKDFTTLFDALQVSPTS